MSEFVSNAFGAYSLTVLFAVGVGINIAMGTKWVQVIANLLIVATFTCLAIAFSARFPWMVPGFLLVAVVTFLLTNIAQRAAERRETAASAIEEDEPSNSS